MNEVREFTQSKLFLLAASKCSPKSCFKHDIDNSFFVYLITLILISITVKRVAVIQLSKTNIED